MEKLPATPLTATELAVERQRLVQRAVWQKRGAGACALLGPLLLAAVASWLQHAGRPLTASTLAIVLGVIPAAWLAAWLISKEHDEIGVTVGAIAACSAGCGALVDLAAGRLPAAGLELVAGCGCAAIWLWWAQAWAGDSSLELLEPINTPDQQALCLEVLGCCAQHPDCEAYRQQVVALGRALTRREATGLIFQGSALERAAAAQERSRQARVACALLQSAIPAAEAAPAVSADQAPAAAVPAPS